MMSADHRARLRRALDAFLADETPATRELRQVAKELAVLPIADAGDRDFGIRLSDGKVVSFRRNEPYEVEAVAVPNAELAVFAHAWTKFPELAALVPTRSADAIDCPACEGSGLIRHGNAPRELSCYCGGLGWLHRDGWEARL